MTTNMSRGAVHGRNVITPIHIERVNERIVVVRVYVNFERHF